MEHGKELYFLISQTLMVEKDLSLPSNFLVDTTASQKSSKECKLKRVRLGRNFMAGVPENVIHHPRELKLCKKVCGTRKTIALLVNAIDVLLD